MKEDSLNHNEDMLKPFPGFNSREGIKLEYKICTYLQEKKKKHFKYLQSCITWQLIIFCIVLLLF